MGYARKSQEQLKAEAANQQTLSLCFGLGFVLEIIGIVIAAIIAKEQGVRAAIRGMLWSLVLWAVVIIFILAL